MPASFNQSCDFSECEEFSSKENYATSTSSSSGYSKRKILPSAEDMYLSLMERELDFIGKCRLAQVEEDEKHLEVFLNSSPTASTFGFLEDDITISPSEATTENVNSTSSIFSSDYFSTKSLDEIPKKKRIIHPELELGLTHHIPDHILAYEASLQAEEEALKQKALLDDESYRSQGRGRLIGNYWRPRNTTDISMRVFGPNRSDSIFKFMFGKFRDQHRLK